MSSSRNNNPTRNLNPNAYSTNQPRAQAPRAYGHGHNDSGQTTSQSQSPSTLNPSTAESTLGDSDIGNTSASASALGQRETDFGQLAGLGFPPGGPLVWGEWNNPLDFGEFSTFYQPQGELAQELQLQQLGVTEFSNPIPVRQQTAILPPPEIYTPSRAQFFPPERPTPSPRQGSTSSRSEGGHPPIPSPLSRTPSISMPSNTQTQMAEPSGSRSRSGASATRAGAKRKADTDTPSNRQAIENPPPKRPSVSKPSQSSGQSQSPRLTRSHAAAPDTGALVDDDTASTRKEAEGLQRSESGTKKKVEPADSNQRIIPNIARLTTVLPAGKVFPIQIGSELFRLSGASLSSDAPSYFSHYFGEQLIQTGGRASQVKTLYIDRDPMTFRDIGLHLQGYYVKPRDEEHFVRLFADAQFYSLPRLTQQLFKSEIFIQVGDRHFQIPRDIFSAPGDSPNFFSLGFAHFFSTPSEVFPGLDRQTLLRPPSILPPTIPNRSGDVFADLLRLLQGYDVNIRDAGHRAELLRDARYFHLKGLEQRLLPCEISYNALRGRSEILLRLEDLRQSGVSFVPDTDPTNTTSKPGTPLNTLEPPTSSTPSGRIVYQRPFIDDTAHELILEISTVEAMTLDVEAMRATFTGKTKARIASLFQVIANKLNLPSMLPLGLIMMQSGGGIAALPASPANSGVSGDRVRIHVDKDAWMELDGSALEWDDEAVPEEDVLPKIKRWKDERTVDVTVEWICKKGHWRLRVGPAEGDEGSGKVEVSLCAVRVEAMTREMHRNQNRGFLT